jgi:pimeloyl-ACP methyl ester carboxylesterase
VAAPGIVLQGRLDRLVPVSGVQQVTALQPDWPVHLLDGVGHVPQIEAPGRTAALLLPWLDALRARPAPRGHRRRGDRPLAGAS